MHVQTDAGEGRQGAKKTNKERWRRSLKSASPLSKRLRKRALSAPPSPSPSSVRLCSSQSRDALERRRPASRHHRRRRFPAVPIKSDDPSRRPPSVVFGVVHRALLPTPIDIDVVRRTSSHDEH